MRVIYSITETARANSLNVYYYIRYLLTELMKRKDKDGNIDEKQCWNRSCHGRKNFRMNVIVSAANEQRRIIWQEAEDLTFTYSMRRSS